jgi:hypothetical protein
MNRNMAQGSNNNGSDIVTSMVNEMGLTPSRAEFLQNQQGQPLNMPPAQGMMPGGQEYPDPESQLEMMETAARGEPEAYRARGPPQQVRYQDDEQDEEEDAEDDGDEGPEVKPPPESFFDRMLRYLKIPVIVALLFVLFSLPYTNTLFQQFLPAGILGNSTYFLLVKTVLVGLSFALVHLAIE